MSSSTVMCSSTVFLKKGITLARNNNSSPSYIECDTVWIFIRNLSYPFPIELL